MADKKSIMFDFNLILQGFIDNSSKTGLYWAEYYIVSYIIKNYSDSFKFFAYCDCEKEFFDNNILKEYPVFNSLNYTNLHSKRENTKKFLNKKIGILRKDKKFSSSFFKKIALISRIFYLKILKIFSNFLSKKEPNLNFIDIYQSFYYPFPKIILNNQKIKKFIIVHDILPITHLNIISKNSEEGEKVQKSFLKHLNFDDKSITIFSDSEYTKNELLKYFPKFQNNKIIVNLLGFDETVYYKESNNSETLIKYNIVKNQKYILSLSSLNKRKNLAFLIDCFIEFIDTNKIEDLFLILAGPKSTLMDEMLNSIKNSGKYINKIILTGFIDEKDIRTIYNNAFCFVFPSLAEGFGLPVLEAMACGIPVISSNTTSLPEVYQDSAIGINPESKSELLEALKKIYYNDNLRKELIQKSLKKSKNFSWAKTAKIIITKYNKE